MARLRASFCAVLSFVFVVSTALGASAPPLGTITTALGAHVGSAMATTGATIFSGDRLSTLQTGSLQVRTSAARLMLSGASTVTMSEGGETPGAILQAGTAVFSTANAKAFVLHASTADIRPQTDEPTIAQVTYVNAKELIVRSTRGSIAITVEGETQIVPDAMAYRVILDPDSYPGVAADAQGPEGAGSGGKRGTPRKAGRSRFLLLAIIVTGIGTGIALHEVLESPNKP